jgi:hypothetical protein
MQAKRSSRKREHSLNDKSENGVFLANEKRSKSLSKNKHDMIQPFISANKAKEN